MKRGQYPECEKLQQLSPTPIFEFLDTPIFEFLEWLEESGLAICAHQDGKGRSPAEAILLALGSERVADMDRHLDSAEDHIPEGYYPVMATKESLVYQFGDIDPEKLEVERRAMLQASQDYLTRGKLGRKKT